MLAACAAEVGFDRDHVLALLDTDAGMAEVAADIERATELGITGVPAYVIDGRWSIPGAQDTDTFVTVLRRLHDRITVEPATGVRRRRLRCLNTRLVFLHGFTQTHHHWHACAPR